MPDSFRHQDDTHGGALKGRLAQEAFSDLMEYRNHKVEKTDRETDRTGIDFIVEIDGVRLKVAVSGFFYQEYNAKYLRVPMGSEGNKKISNLCNTQAEWWAYFSSAFNGCFYIINIEEFRNYIKSKYDAVNKPELYVRNLGQAAREQKVHIRPREKAGGADLIVYPPIEDVLRDVKVYRLEIPAGACKGVLK